MAENKVTKEHFIPRVYLEMFTYKNHFCYVYDKVNKKYFTPNINNIMAERYFYDFSEELLNELENNKLSLDPQFNEKALGKTVDGFWNNIISNIDNNFQWFSMKYPHHYLDVYRCTAIQILRTPYGKQMLLKTYSEIYKKDFKKYENLIFTCELLKILNEEPNSELLLSLLNEFSHICIGINNSKIPFITSDAPLYSLPNIWIKNEEMFYYPITPTRCIFLFKRKTIKNKLNEVLNDYLNKNFQELNLGDILKEADKREKNLANELNPLKKQLTYKDVLLLNSTCFKVSNKYIVSNIDMQKNKLWV